MQRLRADLCAKCEKSESYGEDHVSLVLVHGGVLKMDRINVFLNCDGLPGEHTFVDWNRLTDKLQNARVGGHFVADADFYQIAGHDFTPIDSRPALIAQNERVLSLVLFQSLKVWISTVWEQFQRFNKFRVARAKIPVFGPNLSSL